MKHFKKIMCLISTLCILITLQIPSLPVQAAATCNYEFWQSTVTFDYEAGGTAVIYLKNKNGIDCTENDLTSIRDSQTYHFSLNGDKISTHKSQASLENGYIAIPITINGKGSVNVSLVSWLEETYATINITISDSSSPSSDSTATTTSTSSEHTHSFSWVTVQEATTSQDGIEEYRCDCGMVEERSVIPSSQVYVKGLYGAIKNAPENGEATFDSGKIYTISDYIIKKLQERSDVKTIINFEYQNAKYKMTIPAGVDYTKLLEDQYYFYGYFFFANEVGAIIESL